MTGFSATIAMSSKELTAKERIQLKDTTSALKLDEITQTEDLIIHPEMYAELDIHNENSQNVDYKNYVVVDKSGRKYVTGSTSFWSAFIEIAKEMENESEEWGIKVYRMPSKNYKGKEFITCTIV